MHILITGAAGFIGCHLARALVEKGHKVRGLLLPHEEGSDLEKMGVEIFRGDLTQPHTLKDVAKGIDLVYHLAARTLDWGSQKQFEAVMVHGTLNLLEACEKEAQRFIYCSSIAAMGLGRDLAGLDETCPPEPCGIPYCDTKTEAEALVKDFCAHRAMGYTIVRPANVFGPGSVWVKDVLDAFGRGPVPLIANGRAPGAFVYIDNLVRGFILAGLSHRAKNRTYFFVDDYPITWGEYMTTISSWIGKAPRGSLPLWPAWHLGRLCEALLTPLGIRPPMTRLAAGVMGRDNSVNPARARAELGWESRISQEEAMAKIKDWVKTVYIPAQRKVS